MKKLHRISLTLLLCVLCALWSCTKEHVRNDISLEMTDQDSVEAIVDQDLLTAGGSTVNIEQEPGSSTGRVDAVAYVDQVEMQKPVLVETATSLKPGAPGAPLTSTSGEELLAAEPVVPVATGAVVSAEVTVTKLGPLPSGPTSADDLARMATEPAGTPGNYNAIRPPGASTIPSVTRTTALPVSYPQHTVKSGDTLWLISKNYGCTISELAAANGLSRRSILRIGQTLVVPASRAQEGAAAPPVASTVPGGPSVTLAPAEGQSATGDSATGPANAASGTVALVTGMSDGGAPTATKIPSGETETYAIQQGDSYWKIAKKHSVTASDLMTLNDTTSDKLSIGQKILVPKK